MENELADLRFFDVPLSATLNDTLVVKYLNMQGHRYWATPWLYRLIALRHRLQPCCKKKMEVFPPAGRILITWLDPTPRLAGIMLPVLQELKNDPCTVVCGTPGIAPLVPAGMPSIEWSQVWPFAVGQWRNEYRRCRSAWADRLKALCRCFNLPFGAFEELMLALLIASQKITGCLAFLRACRPAAIVTDYDRNQQWSCLVLAARRLGIPTVTLVHGVMHDDAIGYSPVLADRIVCWGEFDRKKLIAAGEPPEKVVIGGCPRLSRELSADAVKSREKLSLDQNKPVVMFATSPEMQRLTLTESFCAAVARLDFLSAVVRLHPAENMADYESVARRYSGVRFFENSSATLDEFFAAADVVVVHSSGVGSDALVKGRLAIVLDFEAQPVGHAADLIRYAGCPHARTSEELAEILRRMLLEDACRRSLTLTAERFVERFCSFYAEESAGRIAAIVRKAANLSEKK